MDKYLIELLKEVNTIIIPGLGALTITNKEKGEYMFMPYLKHDDGTLAGHIAEREGWSENDAKNLIAKYVREIEAKLNVGESYDMFQFGSFRKTSGGDIEFEPWTGSAELSAEKEELVKKEDTVVEVVEEAPTISEVSSESEEEIEELVTEEKTIATQPDELINENAFQPETVQESEPDKVEGVDSPGENAEIVYTEEQQWNDDLDLPPLNAKIERPKKPILEKAKKDNKRRIPVLLIVIAVIIVGAATSVGIFYNEIKTSLFAEQSSDTTKLAEGRQFEFTDEPQVEESESTEDDIQEKSIGSEEQVKTQVEPVSAPKNEPAPEPVKKEVKKVKPTQGSGSFHLIIGSFQNQQFAENFSKKAEAAGHSSTVIGPKGNFYLVTIGSYTTESEAKNALVEKQAAYPKVWLLKSN